jgi:hypothetical protein
VVEHARQSSARPTSGTAAVERRRHGVFVAGGTEATERKEDTVAFSTIASYTTASTTAVEAARESLTPNKMTFFCPLLFFSLGHTRFHLFLSRLRVLFPSSSLFSLLFQKSHRWLRRSGLRLWWLWRRRRLIFALAISLLLSLSLRFLGDPSH